MTSSDPITSTTFDRLVAPEMRRTSRRGTSSAVASATNAASVALPPTALACTATTTASPYIPPTRVRDDPGFTRIATRVAVMSHHHDGPVRLRHALGAIEAEKTPGTRHRRLASMARTRAGRYPRPCRAAAAMPSGDPMTALYRSVPAHVDLPGMEREIITFWRQHDIFAKALEQTSARPQWTFFEGPPTANGMPGTHHVEARAFKDVFPRYQTMKGQHVPRKAGW